MAQFYFYKDVKKLSGNQDEIVEMVRFQKDQNRIVLEYDEFIQEVSKPDFDAVCASMGYDNNDPDWTIEGDWSVAYFRTKYAGKECLLFATIYGEFVFLKQEDCNLLTEKYQTPSGLQTIEE